MKNLEPIADTIRSEMEAIHSAREVTLKRSRELIRICAKAIRSMHREEWEDSLTQLATAEAAAKTMIDGVKDYPNLYYTGYTQDSLKEYVEARLAYAFLRSEPFPDHKELGVECSTWLNGAAEAATELRRRILDIIRHGHADEAERLLGVMDEVYSILVTFDFSDSITGGLRRRTDTVRAVLERTRGDVTTSLRQSQLENTLKSLEHQLKQS